MLSKSDLTTSLGLKSRSHYWHGTGRRNWLTSRHPASGSCPLSENLTAYHVRAVQTGLIGCGSKSFILRHASSESKAVKLGPHIVQRKRLVWVATVKGGVLLFSLLISEFKSCVKVEVAVMDSRS